MPEAKRSEQYEGTVVPVGNSRGMRLPAGFFHAHPEFNGKVQVTVLADGAILMAAKTPARRSSKNDEADPVIASFLQFLERQMTEHPQDIVDADPAQLARIGRLVEGVE
ncbi:hypothetical protein BH11PSE9_BH11PSE9_04010 [soil metagenome]